MILFWLIIILISLFLTMPTFQREVTSVGGERPRGFWDWDIQRGNLCIVTGLVTFGLMVTLRTKKKH